MSDIPICLNSSGQVCVCPGGGGGGTGGGIKLSKCANCSDKHTWTVTFDPVIETYCGFHEVWDNPWTLAGGNCSWGTLPRCYSYPEGSVACWAGTYVMAHIGISYESGLCVSWTLRCAPPFDYMETHSGCIPWEQVNCTGANVIVLDDGRTATITPG
jgi:hypothetical protein